MPNESTASKNSTNDLILVTISLPYYFVPVSNYKHLNNKYMQEVTKQNQKYALTGYSFWRFFESYDGLYLIKSLFFY